MNNETVIHLKKKKKKQEKSYFPNVPKRWLTLKCSPLFETLFRRLEKSQTLCAVRAGGNKE
jgi:hypothetical protein